MPPPILPPHPNIDPDRMPLARARLMVACGVLVGAAVGLLVFAAVTGRL